MASSSSSNKSCVQCHDSSSDYFNNGWKFRSSEHAQLCNRCFALYDMRLFCKAFHSDEDGWRDCKYCRKLLHCGCIVSLDDYSLLDTNGVVCMACSGVNLDCDTKETRGGERQRFYNNGILIG